MNSQELSAIARRVYEVRNAPDREYALNFHYAHIIPVVNSARERAYKQDVQTLFDAAHDAIMPPYDDQPATFDWICEQIDKIQPGFMHTHEMQVSYEGREIVFRARLVDGEIRFYVNTGIQPTRKELRALFVAVEGFAKYGRPPTLGDSSESPVNPYRRPIRPA